MFSANYDYAEEFSNSDLSFGETSPESSFIILNNATSTPVTSLSPKKLYNNKYFDYSTSKVPSYGSISSSDSILSFTKKRTDENYKLSVPPNPVYGTETNNNNGTPSKMQRNGHARQQLENLFDKPSLLTEDAPSAENILSVTKSEHAKLLRQMNRSNDARLVQILQDLDINDRIQLAYEQPGIPFGLLCSSKEQYQQSLEQNGASRSLILSVQEFSKSQQEGLETLRNAISQLERADHEKARREYEEGLVHRDALGHKIAGGIGQRHSARMNNSKKVIQRLAAIKQQKIAEIETIKRKEEEHKRRVEEERKKREEERKRKEEEERKRKEEEERKRKEEEERKRKEEEQKRRQQEEDLEKQQAEAKAKVEAEVRKLQRQEEERQKQQAEALKLKETQSKGTSVYAKLLKYRETCDTYRESVKNEMQKPQYKELKSACSRIRRKINPKIGQLTNSISKLNSISEEIVQLIELVRTIASPNPNDQLNAFAFKWVMYTVTKLVINQAESEIRVSMKMGLPLSKLTVYLLIKFPELKEILLAKFMKKCPFILGYSCAIDTVEGRIRMGWKYQNKDAATKQFETDLNYNERVGGIFTLWSLMTVVKLGENSAIFNRLGLDPQRVVLPVTVSKSWIMISRIVNIEDKSIITNSHFFMLCNWVESSSKEFLEAYGKQGEKLLRFVCFEFTKNFSGKDFTSASKLSTLGEEWLKTGQTGILPPMDA